MRCEFLLLYDASSCDVQNDRWRAYHTFQCASFSLSGTIVSALWGAKQALYGTREQCWGNGIKDVRC